ncbi:MAG: tRNA (adenosine(37)-N6)-threonylcarbamoyltransferase complex dimerization subunit type 1 TsaB [Synechococcaceae bacterium WB9_4xC_028]|jgi:tRNA threonylcarbamoyladenosine biosynthesis protein TsaB|uniref:tRNA (adenosine(37)-N6)-threonylcarbamoyltransferase complex dimerization subunit type 1 TsaB n=1 Tax=Synechococcus sp. HK01-R TaxID=2751171 RepID=UPI001629E0BB|nr:tRNA (adenosine(37)-N6)-threonylcarbamoyltransferase complex dimerization subunit type 1 TsaB [Synechococcus sp. HK01-R]NDD69279.1 tRNA (adenosine(37)-N6)-threonylcarbamoyltransferase complex dimerization subunit type 1 TsaB [Synechococcaceae bacterium WB9_4xC_028]QNG27464.1 tRNA (adenosine(37)-N6)-threonylcarbamoyltransferase complex dimerization subunit type 1 TsaB [Synechococcus sp. HK01-R]
MTRWLLALHSSTPALGVAVLDLENPQHSRQQLVLPCGRGLTNELIEAVQRLLPSDQWGDIARLAVAIGPGGFTGTRLTVVMARTLAQQLDCALDGVSSFALMAPRLAAAAPSLDPTSPFWIVQTLPRRGRVAGCYRLNPGQLGAEELEPPALLADELQPTPALVMEEQVEADVGHLLDLCHHAHRLQRPAAWSTVLPVYPTSPVGVV